MEKDWSTPILKWARETFSTSGVPTAMFRTRDEWQEYQDGGRTLEEAADVVIMLCSLVGASTDTPLSEFCTRPVRCNVPERCWASLKYWVREQPSIIIAPAGNLVWALAARHGGMPALLGAVQAKMSVNRKRVWRTDGTGVGQHVG